jgi:hypothetical protein
MIVTISTLGEALLWPSLFVLGYITTCALFTAYQADFKRLYILNPPYKSFLRIVTILHNTGLIVYSATTAGLVVNELYQGRQHGPYIADLCWLFTYSKIWEFLDTYLILARGQPTIFLQKYHHIGALLCWWLCCYYDSKIICMTVLYNSVIHTIMYSYYLSAILGYKCSSIKICITSLQLLQFFGGAWSCWEYYYKPLLASNPSLEFLLTDGEFVSVTVFHVYLTGLVILFLRFFAKEYC